MLLALEEQRTAEQSPGDYGPLPSVAGQTHSSAGHGRGRHGLAGAPQAPRQARPRALPQLCPALRALLSLPSCPEQMRIGMSRHATPLGTAGAPCPEGPDSTNSGREADHTPHREGQRDRVRTAHGPGIPIQGRRPWASAPCYALARPCHRGPAPGAAPGPAGYCGSRDRYGVPPAPAPAGGRSRSRPCAKPGPRDGPCLDRPAPHYRARIQGGAPLAWPTSAIPPGQLNGALDQATEDSSIGDATLGGA